MAVGTAGPVGDEVRSDLHVRYEPADSGALEVQIESKVALYYGDAIEEQARGVATALGVTTGSLSITDQGALPFVIGARVEAALTAGGEGKGQAMPPLREWRPAPGRDALRRSRLYLPGSEPKYMINAGLHGADAVILDLEDSVHATEKPAARYLVRNALATLDFGHAERMVRINQLPMGLEDLTVILEGRPELILIPKVEHPDQVREVAGLAADAGQSPWIMPILESALGIENAFAIATAHDTVVALTIGLEDYTADLGVVKTAEGSETLWARARVVNAARAAGVQAIDSVYGNVGDEDGLRAWATRSRAMGFEGMGCLHPRQIEIIHAGYAPTEQEIERALRIVAAFEEAKAQGKGVVSLGSKMIDPPVVHRAVKLVERARAMGLVAEENA